MDGKPNILEQFAAEILAEVKAVVVPILRTEIAAEMRRAGKVTFTETEAAAMLDLSPETLKKIRRDGKINYSQTARGRKIYLPEHIKDYAKRREIRNF